MSYAEALGPCGVLNTSIPSPLRPILQFSSTARGMILVLVPVIIELIFLTLVGFMLYDAGIEYKKLQRSRDGLMRLHKFQEVAEQALLSLANEEITPTNHENRMREIDSLLVALEVPWSTMSDEHPELNAIMKDSEDARMNLIELLKQVRLRFLKTQGRAFAPGKLLPQSSTITMFMNVRPLSKRIIAVETDMLNSDAGQLETLTWKLGWLLAGGGIFGFIISLCLVRDFTSVFLNRLGSVANKAFLLAGGKELPPPIDGNDELAELDRILLQAQEELKSARQKQFAILDNAKDVIFTLDSRLRFITAGAATEKVWQYSSDELLGLSVLSIVSEPTQELTRGRLTKLAETGGDSEFENDIKCKDGALKTFLWKVSFSKEQANFFCVAHDVSNLKAVQQLKQQFLTTASEGLRTPLDLATSLVGSLISESSAKIPPGAQEELAKANYNLTRLTDLVCELLELEALETMKREIAKEKLSAKEVCRQAGQTLEALAGSNSIKMIQPHNDATIYGDERRLVQALINLLSNAIKFSPQNSTVTIAIENNAHGVTISVTDEGPGVAPDDREDIFAKFRQTATAKTSKIKGSGLGLALVKSIAEAHGGEAGFKPGLKNGSTFFISLPRDGDTSEGKSS